MSRRLPSMEVQPSSFSVTVMLLVRRESLMTNLAAARWPGSLDSFQLVLVLDKVRVPDC